MPPVRGRGGRAEARGIDPGVGSSSAGPGASRAQQRRPAALEAHRQADQAGPQPGRRGQRHRVGYSRLHFRGPVPGRLGRAECLQPARTRNRSHDRAAAGAGRAAGPRRRRRLRAGSRRRGSAPTPASTSRPVRGSGRVPRRSRRPPGRARRPGRRSRRLAGRTARRTGAAGRPCRGCRSPAARSSGVRACGNARR